MTDEKDPEISNDSSPSEVAEPSTTAADSSSKPKRPRKAPVRKKPAAKKQAVAKTEEPVSESAAEVNEVVVVPEVPVAVVPEPTPEPVLAVVPEPIEPASPDADPAAIESAAPQEEQAVTPPSAPERSQSEQHRRHHQHHEPRPPRPPEPVVFAEGIVEVSGKGFGFLREPKRNFTQSNNDVFVTPEVIRKHGLRDGMWIKGETRRGPRGPQLYKLTELEREDPDLHQNLPVFEELTTVSPNRRIVLETSGDIYTTRVIDLVSPIGRGQRGLIVAPPRTGKTTLLQHIAAAVVQNHKDIHLIILLVDERPEEVTEIRRTVPGAEVMASSNDCDVKTHTRISQLAIERAKRLVEMGKDVFVLMD
ncbi:MAG: hypothetical protein ACOVMP_01045, partial [Chthoniobacterales bacterium]